MSQALLHPDLCARATELAERFAGASPFRHVIIEPFFAPEFARRLIDEFPRFDRKKARNEDGEFCGKAVHEKVSSLGPAYAALDALVQSRPFLELIGEITGIPELRYDPNYFGGGTHENLHGQDLDPHIDFNFHPITKQHRRLNLIVYLNEAWEERWGGALDLHRNPHVPPDEDEIIRVLPLANRCVIFETTECSWHGFTRIDLPESRRDVSRKSFALYYYTDERPREETGKPHSTVYVERHLPDHLTAGHVLTDDDVRSLQVLLKRRDQHLQRLYRDNADLGAQLDRAKNQLAFLARHNTSDTETIDTGETDETELSRLRLANARLHAELQALHSSTSWRVTEPLRRLRTLLS